MLGLASCQNEPEGLGVVTSGEVDTVVTVAIPEAETRANWNNSAEGVFANGVLEGNATMRYIFQVYYKSVVNGQTTIVESSERQVKYSDGTTVSFPVRLIPNRDYQFVVWADVVNREADVDNHYKTADLTNITLNETWVAMDETRDAFTATYAANNFNGAQSINIPLYRPFAKLRVVTTDYDELAKIDVQATKSSIEYRTAINVGFNAFAGDVTDETKTVSHNPAAIKTYANETGDAHTIFADYFFAPQNGTVVRFILQAFDQNDQLIKENRFTTDIPVKANYLTTLKGDVLTDGNNINVEVVENGAFAAENEWPKTDAEKLAYAAMFGGEVTLTEDVTLAEPLKIVEGANVVLNLGGKTITTDLKQEGRHHYAIDNYGTLTLEGEGAINARGIENFGTLTVNGNVLITNIDTNGGAAIWNEGKATINGGTFATSNEAGATDGVALNTRIGGEAIVNGGKFIGNCPLAYAIINMGTTVIYNADVKGKHGAVATTNGTTTIYNGTFEQVDNPDTSDHCIYASGSGVATVYGGKYKIEDLEQKNGGVVFCENQGGTITIAEGYKTIEKNDWFYVVADSVDAVADEEIKNKEGVEYNGDNNFTNALWFNNYYFDGEAAIVFDINTSYNAIIIENCSGNFKNNVITDSSENNPVMILENLNFTIDEGKKLITSTKTRYQVFMANITINGELMTQETIGQYLENVEWYQVVDPELLH